MSAYKQENLIGQLSIFDIPIIEKPKNITKIIEKIAETKVQITNIHEISPELQSVVDFYKTSDRLNRIIKYCGGGIGIELLYENSFKTIYVNTKGSKEFVSDKKSSVLPMDTILYYKNSDIQITNIQEERLTDLLDHTEHKRIIKRNGDENILIEADGKIIAILQNGWVLEFESISSIDCTDDEVYMLPKKKELSNIGEVVKVGDFVKAYYGKRVIEGPIVREYGLGNSILNINFELEGTKCQTAIGRLAVIEILS